MQSSRVGSQAITAGLSGEARGAALNAANESITNAWRVCMVLCCVSFVAALAVEHRKMKGQKKA